MKTGNTGGVTGWSKWGRAGARLFRGGASVSKVMAALVLLGFTVGGAPAAEPLGSQIGGSQGTPMPASFASIVKQVRPAVVSVRAKVSPQDMLGGEMGIPEDHPFHDFFRRFFHDDLPSQGQKGDGWKQFSSTQGSGFIISEDGYVVTNNHVIDNAVEVIVVLDDGTEYNVERIGVDPKTDLALLKINTTSALPYVALSEEDVEIGDWVIAVGNPFGLGGSVTAGIVSARGRDIGAGPYDDFIQIDAPINRGNSGGPAFNLRGQVVGVNTAIFSPSGGNVGIAFAIPAGIASSVIEQLKIHGGVKRGWLGVSIQTVTEDIATSLGLAEPKGAIISELLEDGPARRSGLKEGDVILEVNGQTVESAKDLARKVAETEPGTSAEVLFLRDGVRKTTRVQLEDQPLTLQERKHVIERGEVSIDDLGLVLVSAKTAQLADEEGVLIAKVGPGSQAAEKGLSAGDVILEAGGKSVLEPGDVVREIENFRKEGRKAILLRVKSNGSSIYVALALHDGKGE